MREPESRAFGLLIVPAIAKQGDGPTDTTKSTYKSAPLELRLGGDFRPLRQG
jgi:hypothetical protein